MFTSENITAWATAATALAAIIAGVIAGLALRSSNRQAQIAQRALDASLSTTAEIRKEFQLGCIPFLWMDRLVSRLDSGGSPILSMTIMNLGPGIARDIWVEVEAARSDANWQNDNIPSSRLSFLEEGKRGSLTRSALTLVSIPPAYQPNPVQDDAGGWIELPHIDEPKLWPHLLRVTLRYSSVFGGGATQFYVCDVPSLEQPSDALNWRLERISLDPGKGNGDTIEIGR